MITKKHIRIYQITKKVTTSNIEIKDLLIGWFIISLSFAFVLSPERFLINNEFLFYFVASGVGVGLGFIFHEIGHKILAQKYGCFAEFRANYPMLAVALLMSIFLKVVFAAPGAVIIAGGHVDFRRNGKIAAVGPLVNLILSFVFLIMLLLFQSAIFKYGFFINAWLALFNMIPFGFFDGVKIFKWNKAVYVTMIFFAVVLVLLSSI
ncbi:MAG: site-2 protease family protein [Candidatus Woesearchaeota archaeon]